MAAAHPNLNERAQTLLKALVERYITDGQPVGSRALSRMSGLDLSPASIRNVMADLEEMGLITSPHTSAGRIPTPRGYRLFVDTLLKIKPLDSIEIHELEGHLQNNSRQKLVASASHLLSDLTHFAGLVMTPRRAAMFRHIEFVGLTEKRILLIIVSPEGDVQNRILTTNRSYNQSELVEAANMLNQHYAGLSFNEIQHRVHDELKKLREEMSHLMSTALEAIAAREAGMEVLGFSLMTNLAANSGRSVEAEEAGALASIPLGRMGTAEEFANLACFLASDAGSYITGTATNVDGGASPVV